MTRRKIIHIDEEKCDGCGLCVPSCAEGAIQIIGGKARLVSETYCDGLGACLGECPQGAISMVERDSAAFDEEAARRRMAGQPTTPAAATPSPHVCPGSAVRDLSLPLLPVHPSNVDPEPVEPGGEPDAEPSALANWPVQLHLVPPNAPFLKDADVLLVADCVPFALADFHRRYLRGRPVVIGCPKLDNAPAYVDKLTQMLTASSIRSLTVIHMEVPCCTGLLRIAQAAIQATGRDIPIDDVTISIRGNVVNRT
jgi:Pyruvate/2-oxoacid:ferredoxin oxidoreductase delta subunit